MNFKTILLLVAACVGIASCNQEQKAVPVAVTPVAKKPTLEEPFKFHKMIEVTPGRYYDVLSWGRGTKGGGAYMILRSDSTDQRYDSTSGDLEGPIQDVLNADMDIDGNPEIIIQAKSIDTSRYTNVFVYEYNGSRSQKIDFPRMTPSQRKGYRGDDYLFIKDSKLMRQFPIFDGTKPTGEKRLLEYSLHNNSFSVRTISSDNSSNAKKTDVTPVPTPAPAVKKKSETKKSSSKKHTTEKKSNKTETKKKHKKHHSSN